MGTLLYKIVPEALWRQAEAVGHLTGSPIDAQDGFIHLSSAEQVRETAARHFVGQNSLLLLAVDQNALGPALRWEPSRGGALFPHLYGPLQIDAVCSCVPLPLGPEGEHRFPDGIA